MLAERENARFKAQLVAAQREQKEREAQKADEKAAQRAKWRDASFPNPPTTRSPGRNMDKGLRKYTPAQVQRSRDEGYER